MDKKEMKYKSKQTKPTLLYKDEYLGYEYYVVSVGTHPTAYVKVDKDHPNYGKDYSKHYGQEYSAEQERIPCHGGVTYARNYLGDNGEIVPESDEHWIIGWDYAHSGDFVGYIPHQIGYYEHWSTDEIIEEIEEVILFLYRQQYPENIGVPEFAPERLKESIQGILREHCMPLWDEEKILLITEDGLTRVNLPKEYQLNANMKEEIRAVFPYTHEVEFEYR